MNKVRLDLFQSFSPEKMKKIPLFESDHLFYDLYCLEAGQSQKIHAHEGSDKIYLTLEGRPAVTVGGERETLEPGEAVIAPSGEDHGVENPSGERAMLLVVMAPKP
jgi:quercetin dioxygenase-like cupin family protein